MWFCFIEQTACHKLMVQIYHAMIQYWLSPLCNTCYSGEKMYSWQGDVDPYILVG